MERKEVAPPHAPVLKPYLVETPAGVKCVSSGKLPLLNDDGESDEYTSLPPPLSRPATPFRGFADAGYYQCAPAMFIEVRARFKRLVPPSATGPDGAPAPSWNSTSARTRRRGPAGAGGRPRRSRTSSASFRRLMRFNWCAAPPRPAGAVAVVLPVVSHYLFGGDGVLL